MKNIAKITGAIISVFMLFGCIFQSTHLTAMALDKGAPIVSIRGWEEMVEAGSEIALPEITLNEQGDIVVSVVDPNGEITKTIGDEMIYGMPYENDVVRFTANHAGQYLLLVIATDLSGNTTRTNTTISVYDDTAPQLQINGSLVTTAKVGEKVVVPKATATDKTPVEIFVYVITPWEAVIRLAETDAGFIPSCAGIYKIIYVANDTASNISTGFYKMVITEV